MTNDQLPMTQSVSDAILLVIGIWSSVLDLVRFFGALLLVRGVVHQFRQVGLVGDFDPGDPAVAERVVAEGFQVVGELVVDGDHFAGDRARRRRSRP